MKEIKLSFRRWLLEIAQVEPFSWASSLISQLHNLIPELNNTLRIGAAQHYQLTRNYQGYIAAIQTAIGSDPRLEDVISRFRDKVNNDIKSRMFTPATESHLLKIKQTLDKAYAAQYGDDQPMNTSHSFSDQGRFSSLS